MAHVKGKKEHKSKQIRNLITPQETITCLQSWTFHNSDVLKDECSWNLLIDKLYVDQSSFFKVITSGNKV